MEFCSKTGAGPGGLGPAVLAGQGPPSQRVARGSPFCSWCRLLFSFTFLGSALCSVTRTLILCDPVHCASCPENLWGAPLGLAGAAFLGGPGAPPAPKAPGGLEPDGLGPLGLGGKVPLGLNIASFSNGWRTPAWGRARPPLAAKCWRAKWV